MSPTGAHPLVKVQGAKSLLIVHPPFRALKNRSRQFHLLIHVRADGLCHGHVKRAAGFCGG